MAPFSARGSGNSAKPVRSTQNQFRSPKVGRLIQPRFCCNPRACNTAPRQTPTEGTSTTAGSVETTKGTGLRRFHRQVDELQQHHGPSVILRVAEEQVRRAQPAPGCGPRARPDSAQSTTPRPARPASAGCTCAGAASSTARRDAPPRCRWRDCAPRGKFPGRGTWRTRGIRHSTEAVTGNRRSQNRRFAADGDPQLQQNVQQGRMNRVLNRFGEQLMPACGGQLNAEDFIAVQGEIGDAPQAHPMNNATTATVVMAGARAAESPSFAPSESGATAVVMLHGPR